MDFFISDCHFGHKNIIKYMNRPYDSADSMDLGMIKSWNSVVTKSDTVLCSSTESDDNNNVAPVTGTINVLSQK